MQENQECTDQKNAISSDGNINIGRIKYWKELSAEEKMERTREEVLKASRTIERLSESLRILTELFGGHIHEDGKIFYPASDSALKMYGATLRGIDPRSERSMRGEEYF